MATLYLLAIGPARGRRREAFDRKYPERSRESAFAFFFGRPDHHFPLAPPPPDSPPPKPSNCVGSLVGAVSIAGVESKIASAKGTSAKGSIVLCSCFAGGGATGRVNFGVVSLPGYGERELKFRTDAGPLPCSTARVSSGRCLPRG